MVSSDHITNGDFEADNIGASTPYVTLVPTGWQQDLPGRGGQL